MEIYELKLWINPLKGSFAGHQIDTTWVPFETHNSGGYTVFLFDTFAEAEAFFAAIEFVGHGSIMAEAPQHRLDMCIVVDADNMNEPGVVEDKRTVKPKVYPATPVGRYDALLDKYEFTDTESLDVAEAPILLIERSTARDLYWGSCFESAKEAAQYHISQEHSEDWTIERIVDLRNGEEYQAEIKVTTNITKIAKVVEVAA
jgi:hypothetical protein